MTAPLVAKAPGDVDTIARELARTAAMAKAMPPAWDGAKVAHRFTGTQGENLGRVLPGRGVALTSDLKSLGITKPIPHVFEKSLAMRTIEACGGRERLAMALSAGLLAAKLGALGMGEALLGLPAFVGAITNYDGIINARANGKAQDIVCLAASRTSVANAWCSLITTGATFPAGAFNPASIPGGEALNRGTAGSLVAGLSNPSGGDRLYLITVGFTSTSTLNIILLADLLVAAAGISATTGDNQTVNTVPLTRYTDGAGNLITCEVTTQLGATGRDFRVGSYTNQAGVTGRAGALTSQASSLITGRLLFGTGSVPTPFLPLQGGDFGVRSVKTVNFSGSMGAGVICLYIYRPLHVLPGVGQNVYIERDSTVQIDGLTELVKGTDGEVGCLAPFVLPSTSSTGSYISFLRTVTG